mmetsp:Transcript_17127/g.53099  ORF Transcript_17127/g.53099 Transcript_17127/m.53099 type:complete len:219 (-) Transcript_17127:35-691(-)
MLAPEPTAGSLRASSATALCIVSEQCRAMLSPPWPSNTAYMWYDSSSQQNMPLLPPRESPSPPPIPPARASASSGCPPPRRKAGGVPHCVVWVFPTGAETTLKSEGKSATASSLAARRPCSHEAPARGGKSAGGADLRRRDARYSPPSRCSSATSPTRCVCLTSPAARAADAHKPEPCRPAASPTVCCSVRKSILATSMPRAGARAGSRRRPQGAQQE